MKNKIAIILTLQFIITVFAFSGCGESTASTIPQSLHIVHTMRMLFAILLKGTINIVQSITMSPIKLKSWNLNLRKK